jgi:YfiH family protein
MQPTRNEDLTSPSGKQATSGVAGTNLAPIDYALTVWPQRIGWHGFLGRRGGVSKGLYASLNLSYLAGDSPANVGCNWQRVQACFPPGTELVQVHQVHGNRVHLVDATSRGVTAVADGMVTAAPYMLLGILSADCVPILMMDEEAGIVGALHAGWRGVIGDIATAGVAAIAAIGARPQRTIAALGPAIGSCCFEVDAGLARRFEAEIPGAAEHVRAVSREKAFIDLKGVLSG